MLVRNENFIAMFCCFNQQEKNSQMLQIALLVEKLVEQVNVMGD